MGNQTAKLRQKSFLPVSKGKFWTISSPKMSAKVGRAGILRAEETNSCHHVSMFHIHTYQYLSAPIRVYPDFSCSFSVEHFWIETRQHRRKHSGNMPWSLRCATDSSPLAPQGVASCSNWRQSSATPYPLFCSLFHWHVAKK